MNDEPLSDLDRQEHTAFTKIRYGAIREKLSANHIRVVGGHIADESEITVWHGARIEPHTRFFYQRTLCSMGAFSYTHSKPFNGLSIGRYCSLASNIRIFGADHYTDWIGTSSLFYDRKFSDTDLPLRFEDRMKNRTVIGNDVWIGSDVALARNITIGDGAVIATGSLVLKDVPPFSVVAGVPAQVKKMKFSDEIIERVKKIRWWNYHLDSFSGFDASKPAKFLDAVEQAVGEGKMNIYQPVALTSLDLLSDGTPAV